MSLANSKRRREEGDHVICEPSAKRICLEVEEKLNEVEKENDLCFDTDEESEKDLEDKRKQSEMLSTIIEELEESAVSSSILSTSIISIETSQESAVLEKKLFEEYSFYIYPIYPRVDDERIDKYKFIETIKQHGGEVLSRMKQKPKNSKIALLYNPLATNNLELMIKKHPNPLHVFDIDFYEMIHKKELKDSLFREKKLNEKFMFEN